MSSRLHFPRLAERRPAALLATLALAASLGLGCAGVGAAQAAHAALAAASGASGAAAATDTGGPRWAELNASQRKVLSPLTNDWNGLDSRSKERWIDLAGRFHKMPPDEQQRATQRMGEWSHMTVAQRTQARLNFQESRSVSKEEREERWKAYQALPDDKKRELAKRAAASTPVGASAASAAFARRRTPPSVEDLQPKTNVVDSAAPARAQAGSAPIGTPVRTGATTTLLTRRATPPAHQRDGQPKIAAGPNSIDRTTLLPRRNSVASAASPVPPPAHP